MKPVLSIKDLSIDFRHERGVSRVVNQISFDIPKGKTFGLVGESGSGKSVTALAIMGLLPAQISQVSSGTISFDEQNLLCLSNKNMRSIRGNRIAMIFQDPMTALNPVFTVGDQLIEAIRLHQRISKKNAYDKAIELMKKVGIPRPTQKILDFPHQFSGGQLQRIMIAIALSCEPDLLIADEPTTALDVTIQKQVLDLMQELKNEYQMSILFITHDLAVIGEIADEILVMYRGNLVESGQTEQIFKNPNNSYTKGLLACRPALDNNPRRLLTVNDFREDNTDVTQHNTESPSIDSFKRAKNISQSEIILEVKNLSTHFPIKSGIFRKTQKYLKAVDDVNFKVRKGQTLGLVGESGSGKTTLGRTIIKLYEPTGGKIFFKGQEITNLDQNTMQPIRKYIQMVFQDPYSSLNPRMTVGDIITEPLRISNQNLNSREIKEEAIRLLDRVELPKSHLYRYPHEFSGGQRQRVGIARALSLNPELIICDESVSALDVSVQASVLNLLLDLQEEYKLTYIFISHDLSVVKFISDEIAVLNQGKLVELADYNEIYSNPKRTYTRSLIDAIPKGFIG
ncbi:MAG: ABC transporter ATP-binding protein [Pseudobacteriovorax sp.]|nr:ABC transporter ATP-binding protein [Pseudobacteriovorax sp.]